MILIFIFIGAFKLHSVGCYVCLFDVDMILFNGTEG